MSPSKSAHPMPTLTLDCYGQTDQGLIRPQNEDNFGINTFHQIFAVADGLGGLPQGSLASELAIEGLDDCTQTLSPNAILDFQESFNEINQAIYAAGKDVGSDMGIGTTLTVAHIKNHMLSIGHVGDTGVYLFRKEFHKKLTIDHTMAQEILDGLKPDEPTPYIPEYFHHSLTRCLGQGTTVQVDTTQQHLVDDDRILIYSDGVTKVISSEELHDLALEADSAKVLVQNIIELANVRGGPDNITAVAIFCKETR